MPTGVKKMEEKSCLISVAMIVRDEENNIRRALESVKGCVDEIVVVDTGSADRTPEIVKEYTDRLYFHRWRNDFSEARNYSLKFPKCDWVMILDGDEEASEEFCRSIRNYLKSLQSDVNAVFVPTISYLDWEFRRREFASTARIFRNGTVYYKNIVHNMPVYKPKVVSIPWPIYHYGYIWTRKLRKKKYERTGSLIKKQLEMAKTPEERIYYLVQLYKTESTGGKSFRKSEVALQTFREIVKAKRIPTIGLEFLYYFSSDLMNLGYYDEAERILKRAIKIDPEYPDSYFGMMALYEKRGFWEKIVEWGKKFFEVFDKVVESLNSPKWTVNTMKVTGAASTVIARAYIHQKDLEGARRWIEKAVKYSEENGENIKRFLNIFISDFDVLSCEDIGEASEMVRFLMKYSQSGNINLNFSRFFEKVVECSVKVERDLIEGFEPSDEFSNALKKRLLDGEDHLLDIIPHGNDYRKFVESYGANSLVFLFDYLSELRTPAEKMLKILNELRSLEDNRVQGLSFAFMGDVYLKIGKFKEALGVYRKALGILPEISRFLKPVIEDLKTVITSDTDGVFEEIYRYYNKGTEFVFDVTKLIPRNYLEKLHLLSSSDHALYVSAVTSRDKKRARAILERIKRAEKFPFYYFRLAKTYEEEDWKMAFNYHKRACEENEKLADIGHGYCTYHGLYLSENPKWASKGDEIIWAGNISETFSPLFVISPVRAWRESKDGFYYCIPFHVDEAIDVYFENLKKYRSRELSVSIERISEMLMKIPPRGIEVKGFGFDRKKMEGFLESFGIRVVESSEHLFIPFGLEAMKPSDFEGVLDSYSSGIVIFANPTSPESEVWRYPPFRVVRPYGYLRRLFGKKGYEILDVKNVEGDFYALLFSK